MNPYAYLRPGAPGHKGVGRAWACVLAYLTGVDQDLLARNEYLAAEKTSARLVPLPALGRLKAAAIGLPLITYSTLTASRPIVRHFQ